MYFEIYESSGKYYFRLKAANHEIIATGQGYQDIFSARHAVDLIKTKTNADTPVKELPPTEK